MQRDFCFEFLINLLFEKILPSYIYDTFPVSSPGKMNFIV